MKPSRQGQGEKQKEKREAHDASVAGTAGAAGDESVVLYSEEKEVLVLAGVVDLGEGRAIRTCIRASGLHELEGVAIIFATHRAATVECDSP